MDPEVQVISGSYSPASLAGTPRLRWLTTMGAGIDELVARDPWSLGIEVTNGSGIHAVHMAEFLLSGVLYASERVAAAPRQCGRPRAGLTGAALAGRRLRGRHAVVVGYGSIGRETARLLDAFGVRITAVKSDPARRADPRLAGAGHGRPRGPHPRALGRARPTWRRSCATPTTCS